MEKISREELMQKANLSMDELVQVAGVLTPKNKSPAHVYSCLRGYL